MSNYLAIATVTAVLRQTLYNAVQKDVTGTDVTILPPDDSSLTNAAPRLNLYLYQVTPNTAWRNADLPTRRQDGSLAARPQLGLDLHYLLTAYGAAKENDPEVHRVLGSAVRTLHERPFLGRDEIRTVVGSGGTNPNPLEASDLADQVEMVKIIPHALSTEELSKIWSVFFQTPYRISLAYQASIVLIDGLSRPTSPLPVRERAVYVSPFRQPLISGVDPQMVEPDPGQTLTILGRNLGADRVIVRFETQDVSPDQPVRDDRLTVTVPAGFRAGVHSVRVVHVREIGSPPTLRKSSESNTAAFMLRPRITAKPPITVARKAALTLSFEPAAGREQQVALLIGDREIEPKKPATPPAETTTFDFVIPDDFAAGTHLMRLRIDGSESSLTVDPATGNYNGPVVEITL